MPPAPSRINCRLQEDTFLHDKRRTCAWVLLNVSHHYYELSIISRSPFHVFHHFHVICLTSVRVNNLYLSNEVHDKIGKADWYPMNNTISRIIAYGVFQNFLKIRHSFRTRNVIKTKVACPCRMINPLWMIHLYWTSRLATGAIREIYRCQSFFQVEHRIPIHSCSMYQPLAAFQLVHHISHFQPRTQHRQAPVQYIVPLSTKMFEWVQSSSAAANL